LILLSVAVVFIGINGLEAKKPTKWEWKVGIPNELTASDCNLYAIDHGTLDLDGYVIYESDDFVEVDFQTNEDRQTGESITVFSLIIENTNKDPADPGKGKYSVGFQNLDFIGCRSHCYLGGDPDDTCYAYGFPNFLETRPACCADCDPPCSSECVPFCNPETGVCCTNGGVCCSHDQSICSSLGYPGHWVMRQFMEGYDHPSHGYDHFSLRFLVDTDIEAIEPGECWPEPETCEPVGTGYIWRLNVWNTDETLVGADDDYHNVVVKPWPLSGVSVKRGLAPYENEWIITVDQKAVYEHYIPFHETYYQGKPRGKSGKSNSEYLWAIGAATPFKFVTKWRRVQK
jgi:hypothetical protein